MKYPVIFLATFLFQVLETAISRYAGVNFVTPDMGLVAAIYLGVATGPVGGIITAFAIGLNADMMSMSGLIGANAAIYLLTALLAGLARTRVEVWTIPGQLLLTLVFGFGALVGQIAFQALFEHWGDVYIGIWRIGLVGVLVSTASAPVLFIVFDMLRVAVSGVSRDSHRFNR